ncbi:MAG TPA: hypothetical protein VLX92_15805 [Kofleriaceae bacterium]|nr:hypothetical protein [Kofleriaceae bacterium]
MRYLVRLSALAIAIAAPLVATAQPAPPAPPPPPPDTGSGSATAAAGSGSAGTADEDARIKEAVDRELARVLSERAAKEAADRAAAEAATSSQPAPTPTTGGGELTGESGFMDTRVAFTLTNENMLVSPGQTIPSVPGWRFGTPNSLGVLFFDNYDTRYSGFETLSHAVMYRKFHHDHLEAEAAIVIRINELTGTNINLADDGSYLTLSHWKDPTHHDPTRISITAFPVSADRFRLGYSYRLSWGGDPEYSNRATSATPGVKVQYDTARAYAFVGAKSAVVLDLRTAEQVSALAALGGAGYDVLPGDGDNVGLRLEVNGGYFDRGDNELVDVNNQEVKLFGASFQAALHKGMPVQSSIDYRLYKFNGERVSGLFDPVVYPGGVSWLAMSEFTVIGQTLKDPEKTGSTTVQQGHAGDVNVRVMVNRTRLRLDVSYRDLAFILHSVPSLPTYEDFPTQYSVTPDLFAAVGADQNWNDFLTLGLIAGIEKPATLTSPIGIPGGSTAASGKSTAVIRNNNIDTIITILPTGQSAVPQVALKGTAKLTFGRIFSFLLEVFYSHDGNTTTYERAGCTAATSTSCPDQPFQYVFTQPNQLGVNATLQARF